MANINAGVLVEAQAVEAGDFIPGLDNAYVFDVEENDVSMDVGYSGGPSGLLADRVVIYYHDRDGDENYLIMHPESLLRVVKDN